MKRTLLLAATLLLVYGCQSLPPAAEELESDAVFLKSSHCLEEYLGDLGKVHYGPCLRVVSVNGKKPAVGEDGFLELPTETSLTLGVSCVYRHADGSLIPATVENAEFAVSESTFTEAGQRWYLHAHKQARRVVGCEPTLSRSIYPTYNTD